MSAVLKPAAPAPFAHDVLAGLAQRRKHLPAQWRHDAHGAVLFDRLAGQPEHYPARTEARLLERCAATIASDAGDGAALVAVGASRSMRFLFEALATPADGLSVDPFAERPLAGAVPHGRRVVFVPGAVVAAFSPDALTALLAHIGEALGREALLVAGADATLDPALLLPAYDDAAGAAAAWNKNLLARMNRELGANANLSAFRHEARWDAQQQRVELCLTSLYTQRISVLGRTFAFAIGEPLQTGHVHIHGPVRFQALARRAGWTHRQLWTDGPSRYAVHVLDRLR